MAMDIETGRIEALNSDTMELLTKGKKRAANQFHKALDDMHPGDMHEEMRERRHDEGPPIFRVGEVLEIRGGRFEVMMIDTEKLLLMPVKG